MQKNRKVDGEKFSRNLKNLILGPMLSLLVQKV